MASPMDSAAFAASLASMEEGARMQYLGNSLFPGVVHLTGEHVAGKVTGMLLELPAAQIVTLLASFDALQEAVTQAIEVLPADLKALVQPASAIARTAAPTAADGAAPSPVPAISPTSILSGAAGDLWADEDEDEELPPINALLEAADRKHAAKVAAAPADDAMQTDEANGWVCEWELTSKAAEPADTLCPWIAGRLQEPQVRIVRAVADVLGHTVALELLAATEHAQSHGGMLVPETGKPRTSGGIYVKLLKEARHLPAEAQEATLLRIKTEGNDAKKAQQKAHAKKRHSNHQDAAPRSPAFGAPPPKPAFGDFLVK